MARRPKVTVPLTGSRTETYQHPESQLALRPEVGAQPKFKKTKAPARYRYDSSLAPALDWDGQNPAREAAEALIRELTQTGLELAELAAQPMPEDANQCCRRLKIDQETEVLPTEN